MSNKMTYNDAEINVPNVIADFSEKNQNASTTFMLLNGLKEEFQ